MKALALLLAAVAIAAAGIEYVPTDSRLYDDADLLKTAGLIRSMPSTSRPWTRGEFTRFTAEAESLASLRRHGAGARAALGRLIAEFADELPRRPGRAERRPTAAIAVPETKDARARFDLFSRGFASTDRQSLSLGAVINNRPSDRFVFYDRIEMTAFRPAVEVVFDSSGIHVPGTRIAPWRDVIRVDVEHAYLAFKVPWLRIQFGRDEVCWGPGHTGSVMLDDDAPSLNNIQFSASYPGFRYTSLSALLSRWQTKPRFLAAQRLEVSLWQRLTLGGAMMAVASWDEFQPFELAALCNPLIPIYLTTATLNHGDNFLVGWDAVLRLPQTKLYGQLFLDNYEFNTRADAPDAYGAQLGACWAPPLPFDLRTEYTRVTPFTYYHRRHDIMYENWQVSLGHPLGPDADQLYGLLRVTPLEWLRVELAADVTRRGFYNRGDYTRKSFWHESQHNHAELPAEFPSRGITAEGDTLGSDWAVDRRLTLAPAVEIDALRWLHLRLQAGCWSSENYEGMSGVKKTGVDLALKVEYRY